ncbi:hypothetical protein Cni_G22665 [Canna indica]|uniref:TRF2/HOY1 PH-like domain-containing protein n=1 Tax=Canna indica TaxID=4628 RepID=A0AAQ3KSL2_9LILI|nr:hypothetical protein Cni_G22665 [Canna indica]
MVQLPDSGKRRAESTPPQPAAVKAELEDPLDDEHSPPNKRSKDASAPNQQAMYYNVLEEPGPLGLRLRKSPSLADLIQMRLAQAKTGGSSCATSFESTEVGSNKELKSSAATSFSSKIKASNFPAALLRIGAWECESRYEGDLVAKCYFAKHKLVWEVLEGGLKSKIEFHWSDITAIKATFPEDGHGTMDIVLARPPLFFRETDPQPRKHTLWQATQDFTNGQASIHRRHLLQCPQGLLSKNFEKLIECDPRLKSLSQQPDIILESPYFESQYSVFEDQGDSKSHILDVKDDCGATFSGLCEPSSPCATSSISNKSEVRDSFGRAPDFESQDTPSPCSGIEVRSTEENTSKETETRGRNWWDQLKLSGLRGSMSMTDLVNHISEQMGSGNPSLSSGALPNKEILEDIAQYLLNDSQSYAASDEKSIISRVNSLCCLLQKDTVAGAAQNSQVNDTADARADAGSDDEPYSTPDAELADDGAQPSITRKESFGELLILPRIASMPQFLFNISKDAEKEPR